MRDNGRKVERKGKKMGVRLDKWSVRVKNGLKGKQIL